MKRRIALAALALFVLTACAPTKSVTPTGSRQDTIDQVRGLQTQVRQYGTEFIAIVGGGSPVPRTVRIGPAPCPGRTRDLAEDGAYYVSGGWQLPLAPDKQISTIRAVRDAWQAKGYSIVAYKEFAEFPDETDTRARLEGEDPSTGFTFSVISTNLPTAVGIRVLSTCVTPPDRQYPGDGVAVYE